MQDCQQAPVLRSVRPPADARLVADWALTAMRALYIWRHLDSLSGPAGSRSARREAVRRLAAREMEPSLLRDTTIATTAAAEQEQQRRARGQQQSEQARTALVGQTRGGR